MKRWRTFNPLNISGALCFLCYGALAGFSRQPQDVSIGVFLGLMAMAWLFLAGAFLARVHTAAPIWFWAIAFRFVGIFGAPVLEDDWYRYLWDGRVFAVTGNPYDKPPSQFFTENLPHEFETILGQINYPEVPTIYGPISQFAFLLSYWIAPGQLWPLKVILVAADLATMFLLARILRPKQLLLYAWCPLLIKETAFTAHPDILGILPLVAAVIAVREQRFRTALVLCAGAVAAKILALLVVPLLLLRIPGRYWILFPLALAALYSPFFAQGSLADFSGLKAFTAEWEFNSTVFAVIANGFGFRSARAVCLILLVIFYIYYAARWHLNHTETVPRGDWVCGVFFLLSAVVNPWYLLWLLPFVAVFPSIPGVTALIVVTLSYVHGLNLQGSSLGPYEHPSWVRVVEIAAVGVAALVQVYWRRRTIP